MTAPKTLFSQAFCQFNRKALLALSMSVALLGVNALPSTLLLQSGLIQSAEASVNPTPKIVDIKLPNGQHLYIKEDHSRPIVTIDTWVKTGSVNEAGENNGVSHFLEHLLFKGTEQYKAGTIDRILESRGAQFNAATSDDFTHYYITTAPNYFEEALRLHADMMTHATIPSEELVKERKVVQEEINRANDNPSRQLYVALSKKMYGKHGYAMDTLGPKENIANIPRADILNYYHYWYRPENFNTVIVGDVDAEKVKALVEKEFPARKTLPFGKYQPPSVSEVTWQTGPQSIVLRNPGINQAYLALAMPGPAQQNPDDVYALDIAMLALGSGRSSRLYHTLREVKPIATSVSSANYTQKYSGLVVVDSEMTPDKRDIVKQEVLAQLRKLREEGITQEELEKAKTQYVKDFVFENETTDGTASSIGYNVTIGSLDDYREHVSRVEAVTPERIRKALKTYLDPDRAIMAEMLPEKLDVDTAAEEKANLTLLQTWGNELRQAEQAENQAKAKGEITPVASKTQQADPVHIIKDVLPNGMTLLTKTVEDSATVALRLFIKGGVGVESKPGVATLLASMLSQGTTSRSAEDISRELESKGMSITMSAEDDYLVVTGTAIQEDWGELATILGDVLTNPKLADAELMKKKEQLRQAINASRDTPSSVAFENLKLALYPNHPYGDAGKRVEKSLDSVTRDDLVNYYNRYVVPGNMIASMVGRFDPKTVKSYFASIENKGCVKTAATKDTPQNISVTNQAAQTPAVSPLSKSQTLFENRPNLSAVWMAKGWLAPTISSQREYAALKVLNTLIGSGMSSRLFVNLREKQGLAYVVGSQYPSRKELSSFTMYIGTDPINTDKVQQGFNREMERLTREPVTTKELSEAKSKLIGGFALAHDTNDAQANYMGLYEAIGAGYKFDLTYPDLINRVTSADIQAIAKKIYDSPSITSLVKPEKLPTATSAKAPAKVDKAKTK